MGRSRSAPEGWSGGYAASTDHQLISHHSPKQLRNHPASGASAECARRDPAIVTDL